MKTDVHNHNHQNHHQDHEHNITQELLCHLPYAIFAVSFGLVILSFISALMLGFHDAAAAKKGAKVLFHSFHFMHIVFAATGTLITFFRFSKNFAQAILVGFFSPAFFCTMSDAVLPYIGGRLLGVPMKFHLCFLTELPNVLPFLFVGIINGLIMSRQHHKTLAGFGLSSHAVHITISSLASIFYLVSHGFTQWYAQIGMVFLFLIIAVVVPCTFSDVIVPMIVTRKNNTK